MTLPYIQTQIMCVFQTTGHVRPQVLLPLSAAPSSVPLTGQQLIVLSTHSYSALNQQDIRCLSFHFTQHSHWSYSPLT